MAAAMLAKNAVEQGLSVAAVGQDVDGAGLEGRHGLLREGRHVALPREARLPPRRLRLHDVHRQLRSAQRRDLRRRSTSNDLAVVSVLSGNRNFEGRINPDVKMNYLASPPLVIAYALAGTMDFDFETEPLGQRHRRERRLPPGHLARTGGRRADHRAEHQQGDVHLRLRRRLRRRRAVAVAAHAGGQHLRLGRRLHLRPQAPVLRRHAAGAVAGHRHQRRPRARQARRLGDDRPHQPGRVDQGRQPGRARTSPSTASSARTSTPTARAAATTR